MHAVSTEKSIIDNLFVLFREILDTAGTVS